MKRKFKALLAFLKAYKKDTIGFSWTCYEGEDPEWEWGHTSIQKMPTNIKNIATESAEMFWEKVYDDAPGSDTEYYRIVLTIYPFKNKAEIRCDYEMYDEQQESYSRDINDEKFIEMFNRKEIDEITARYNGGGDSGEIEYIEIDGKAANISWGTPDEDEKLIQNTLYDDLERAFGGWEIDDGSNGEIKIYKPEDYDDTIVIDIEHYWNMRIMEESSYKKEITENDFEE
jgi:hypothetical protein